MLTKETKKRAEEIKEQLAPLFKRAEKLQKEQKAKEKEAARVRYVARVWHYVGGADYDINIAQMSARDVANIKELKNNDPKKWSEEVDRAYKDERIVELAEAVANINLINYLNYLSKKIFLLVRPTWQLFKSKKGFESLGEFLTGWGFHVSFAFDGEALFKAQDDPNYYIYYKIRICGNSWATRGEYWGAFYNSPKNTNEEETAAPHILTVTKYIKIINKLEKLEKEARHAYNEQTKTIQGIEAIKYYNNLLQYPQIAKNRRD